MNITRLSVNVNKIALIRNSRGGNIPNLLEAVQRIQEWGADGITVHPRPDGRHILYRDVREIKPLITTEFNVEGYPSPEFIKLVCEVQPHQVTLVPDPPNVLTSNQGWNVKENVKFLTSVIKELHANQIRTSIFIEPDEDSVLWAKETDTDRIELFTGHYAKAYESQSQLQEILKKYIKAAEKCIELKIGINAGHDLNLKNLTYFLENVPGVLEVSIGHALISDALYFGLQNVILMYKSKILRAFKLL